MFVDFSLAFTGILNRMMMFKLIMGNCNPASLPACRQAGKVVTWELRPGFPLKSLRGNEDCTHFF